MGGFFHENELEIVFSAFYERLWTDALVVRLLSHGEEGEIISWIMDDLNF